MACDYVVMSCLRERSAAAHFDHDERALVVDAKSGLAALRGSGPQGRIVKSDIEAALTGGRGAPAAVSSGAAAPGPAERRGPRRACGSDVGPRHRGPRR